MKIGFNVLLWTTFVTEKDFHLFEKLKATGYDGVEVPIFEGNPDHYAKVGQALNDNGLQRTAVTVIPDEERNPLSADAGHRQGGVEYLKWATDCAEALKAELVCGPFYQPLGIFTGEPPTAEEKERGAEVHRQAAEYAQKADIPLVVEGLNRFECYFLNTMSDLADHVRRVNHPYLRLMYDTFHANIEEKDPAGCLDGIMDLLRHVHISENDRGTPGRGHIPIQEALTALRRGGYDGWLTIEAFGRALPDLAAATRVWRDFFGSPEEVYTEGFKLVKEGWEKAGT